MAKRPSATGRTIIEEGPEGFALRTQRPFLRWFWRDSQKPVVFPLPASLPAPLVSDLLAGRAGVSGDPRDMVSHRVAELQARNEG